MFAGSDFQQDISERPEPERFKCELQLAIHYDVIILDPTHAAAGVGSIRFRSRHGERGDLHTQVLLVAFSIVKGDLRTLRLPPLLSMVTKPVAKDCISISTVAVSPAGVITASS